MLRYPFVISCFLAIALLSCSKKKPVEIAELTFPLTTYYVPNGGELALHINQGNQKYQLAVDDETILQAQAEGNVWPAGRLLVKGLKNGSTVLHVKDQVNGTTIPLNIHVVDPFLVLRLGHSVPAIRVADTMPEETRNTIRNAAKVFNDFELDDMMILHRNAAKRFFVFEKGESLIESNMKQSGTYELVFSADGEQQITFNFDGENTPVTLGVQVNSRWAIQELSRFADGDSNEAATTATKQMRTIRAESPIEHFDRYFRVFKDLTTHFQATYPDVESVELHHEMQLWSDFQNYGVSIGAGVLQ